MNVSLTPELEKWVNRKAKSGMYRSSSEVVREGLRLLKQREDQRQAMLEDLRTELQVGTDQLDAGKSRVFDGKLRDRIKQRARKKAGK